jgi:hypothetical protein
MITFVDPHLFAVQRMVCLIGSQLANAGSTKLKEPVAISDACAGMRSGSHP